MDEIIEKLTKQNEILKIDNTFVEIKNGVELKKGIALKTFIKKENDKIYLTDNKNTLRFMNTIYQLDSHDVKQCINDVVNFYKFKIEKGEIKAEISALNAKKRYNEFLICCATLANMFIFFDDPIE